MDAYLNSTLQVLMLEIYGRKNLGDGLLTTYGPELTSLPALCKVRNETVKKARDALNKLCSRNVESILKSWV